MLDHKKADLQERKSTSSCPSAYTSAENQLNKQTDMDHIRNAAVNALLQPGVVSQITSSSSAPRTLNEGYINYDTAKASCRLHDGSAAKLLVPELGYACKTDGGGTRVVSRQLRHAIWCASLGHKSVHPHGSKMFPTEMERTMRLCGTREGEAAYPREVHMLASASGQATFKLSELLSAQQLKSYAPKSRAQLLVQLRNLEEREARAGDEASVAAALAAEQLANPEQYRVERMKGKDLKAELRERGLIVSGTVGELKARLLADLLM